jgi:hypothetical protein
MKKNMIIGAVLFIISLTSSVAQNGVTVNASVAASFANNFAGASEPRWTAYEKNISLAKFKFMDRAWLAYFNSEGHIITSGRKVSLQELPSRVNEQMLSSKQNHEKKYGPLSFGTIYEMVTESEKAYFIPLVNNTIQLLISVQPDGTVELKRRTKVKSVPGNPSVIARTN